MIQLSIIIPVLNESLTITAYLQKLKVITQTLTVEIIVVDGGSHDDTIRLSIPYANKVIQSPKGRAVQMNAGADQASGNVLFFLHADTQLPDGAFSWINNSVRPEYNWGFYRVKLSGNSFIFRIIETMMNVRSQLTRVATGDQCLFVKKSLFQKNNGFAKLALLEDVEICKRLRSQYKPNVIDVAVITSSRRWEEKGIVNTIVLMWYLRGAYFLGVSPNFLVKQYYRKNTESS
ncbi:MAG: rSAM/selenodomain-associated transferase 2 [Candidatus Endobugula sp.]|jgi:rSAM/selenodomain-associated transferase 2